MSAFAGLTRDPLSFRFIDVREPCAGASLRVVHPPDALTTPPRFCPQPACGVFSRAPSYNLAAEWCGWLPLPAHAGSVCAKCVPSTTHDGQAMVAAWHARPPPIVDCGVLAIGVNVDPVALQHRARGVHPTGECHYRIACPGPLPLDVGQNNPPLRAANGAGIACDSQPGGMEGPGGMVGEPGPHVSPTGLPNSLPHPVVTRTQLRTGRSIVSVPNWCIAASHERQLLRTNTT